MKDQRRLDQWIGVDHQPGLNPGFLVGPQRRRRRRRGADECGRLPLARGDVRRSDRAADVLDHFQVKRRDNQADIGDQVHAVPEAKRAAMFARLNCVNRKSP